jgi:hypothetical protein
MVHRRKQPGTSLLYCALSHTALLVLSEWSGRAAWRAASSALLPRQLCAEPFSATLTTACSASAVLHDEVPGLLVQPDGLQCVSCALSTISASHACFIGLQGQFCEASSQRLSLCPWCMRCSSSAPSACRLPRTAAVIRSWSEHGHSRYARCTWHISHSKTCCWWYSSIVIELPVEHSCNIRDHTDACCAQAV